VEIINNTGKSSTVIAGKCGRCKHYRPLVIKTWRIGDTNAILESCRGYCLERPTETGFRYKQRTDTCKRFERR
jgi:hypothetical protein